MTAKLRKSDWAVRRVSHAEASAAVAAMHYAKGCGNTSVAAFGLFRAGSEEMMGAAIWLPPMRPAAALVSRRFGVPVDSVLCLTRLVVHPDVPTNGASYLMGASMRELKRDPRWRAAVTWADTRMGHTGAIYRATNWTHDGMTAARSLWMDGRGKLVSQRAGRPHERRNVSAAEMEAAGYTRTKSAPKHRFIRRLS